jgi:hypothetical protein
VIFADQRGIFRALVIFCKFATGVNDTGGKFATGFNDAGGKFATGVNDTGGKQWDQLSDC